MTPDNPRISALRSYFLEVVKDLLKRGVIRRKNGESLESLLRNEFMTVAGQMGQDVQAITKEIALSATDFLIRKIVSPLFP